MTSAAGAVPDPPTGDPGDPADPTDPADPADPAEPADPAGPASLRGRAVWTLADQALSSLTNFGLAILVAGSVSAAAFGAYKYSKMSDQQKKDLMDRGKKLWSDNVGNLVDRDRFSDDAHRRVLQEPVRFALGRDKVEDGATQVVIPIRFRRDERLAVLFGNFEGGVD